MFLLNVFIVSLFASLFLLSSKLQEIKNGRQTFVGRFLTKGDRYINGLLGRVKQIASHHQERAFFIFLVHVPSRIEQFFRFVKHRAHEYYHGTNTKIRGKKDIASGQSVSAYMRSMTLARDADKGQL